MEIRLVTTDLDGTLLDACGRITNFTRETLQLCEKRGIPVVLSSGRTFEGIRPLALAAGLHSPIISSNGARIDESPCGPALLEDVLPLEMARSVYTVLEASGLYIECYSGNTIYRLHPELSPFCTDPAGYDEAPASSVLRDEDGFEQRFVDNDPRLLQQEGLPRAYKLAAFSCDPAALEAIRSALSGLDVTINSAFPFNIEIMEKGKGKGRAVRWLADHLGLDISQVMSFGDGTNDLEMLQAAGVGVAMQNAAPELESIAQMTAPANTADGVAHTLRRYALGIE